MCHLSLQPLVKLGLQLSQVFCAMILHMIYISDIYSGNTSFFTLSQTQRRILQHILHACIAIIFSGTVYGRSLDIFWILGPIISTSNYWLTERQVSSGAKQNRWNIDRKRAVKRWNVRLYNAFRLLKQHRPFHGSYSSEPSVTCKNNIPWERANPVLNVWCYLQI